MIRPVFETIQQVSKSAVASQLPQVVEEVANIIEVSIPGQSFVVNLVGYGIITVQAETSIQMGTINRPLVFAGGQVRVRLTPATGVWRAIEYIPSTTCVPTVNPVAPNIPLPTYTPPQDTNTVVSPFAVDRTFPPLALPMGQITRTTGLPPVVVVSPFRAPVRRTVIYLRDTVAAAPLGVQSQNGFVYIAMGNTGGVGILELYTVDVREPWNPVVTSHVQVAASELYGWMSVRGKYLYLLGSGHLYVFDISDPFAPLLAGSVAATFNHAQTQMAVFTQVTGTNTTKTYVAADVVSGGYKTAIYDVTNPAAITLVVAFTGTSNAGTFGKITGPSAFSAGQYRGTYLWQVQANQSVIGNDFLDVWDLSTIGTPVLVSTTDLGGQGGGPLYLKQEFYAYVRMPNVATINTYGYNGAQVATANIGGRDFRPVGNYLYVINQGVPNYTVKCWDNGVAVPVQIGSTVPTFATYTLAMAVHHNRLYIAGVANPSSLSSAMLEIYEMSAL